MGQGKGGKDGRGRVGQGRGMKKERDRGSEEKGGKERRGEERGEGYLLSSGGLVTPLKIIHQVSTIHTLRMSLG